MWGSGPGITACQQAASVMLSSAVTLTEIQELFCSSSPHPHTTSEHHMPQVSFISLRNQRLVITQDFLVPAQIKLHVHRAAKVCASQQKFIVHSKSSLSRYSSSQGSFYNKQCCLIIELTFHIYLNQRNSIRRG